MRSWACGQCPPPAQTDRSPAEAPSSTAAAAAGPAAQSDKQNYALSSLISNKLCHPLGSPHSPAPLLSRSPAAALSSTAAAAAAPASQDPAAALDKQIKALSKKLRQCEALEERRKGGGEPLSAVEQEKLGKVPGW